MRVLRIVAYGVSALILCGIVAILVVAYLDASAGLPDRLVNPNFAKAGTPPPGWLLDDEAVAKGAVALEPAAEGATLRLSPNTHNMGGDKPFGLGQAISIAKLRGRRLTISARLAAEGGAASVVGIALLDGAGKALAQSTLRGDNPRPLAPAAITLDDPVPDTAETAIVFLVADGQAGSAWFDTVAVSDGPAPVPAPGTPFAASATLRPDRPLGPVRPDLFGTNVEWIRNAQGLWNAKLGQLDPTIVALTKAAGIRLLRFPGGVWSDGYDWQNGVGPREKRPETPHLAGDQESSPNVVGTDEMIGLASALGADLVLTLNVGHGTPELAAGWVRYVRGRIPAGRGPHILWELGNELYMADDMSGGHITPAQYVTRAGAIADAVRAVDPDAVIFAIGLQNFGRYRFNAFERWNEVVLAGLATRIDGLAIHDAYAPLLPAEAGASPAAVYRAMLAAPANVAGNLATTSEQLKRFEKGRPLSLAITEWGPLFAVDPKSPFFDHVKTLGSGVFAARTLATFLRAPRVAAANAFKLSDLLNSGWIGLKPDGGWASTPALEALRLHTTTLSGRLLALDVASPTFAGGGIGFIDRVENAPLVEAVAARAEDGRIGIVVSNASLDRPAAFDLALGARLAGEMEVMSGPAPDASRGTGMITVPGLSFAKTADFGTPRPPGRDEITLVTTTVQPASSLHLTLPPLSVTALRLRPAP